jgi:hypothetical protein
MNKVFDLRARGVALSDGWDVVVAGGGPAGCTAAAAAAREGAKVLLLEATGSLGGMGTSGLVPMWMTFGDGEKMILRGLAERVFLESLAGMPHAHPEWFGGPVDAEVLKRVYDRLVGEFGVTVLFNTFVAGVELASKGVLDALLVANKSGLAACRGKVYVDGTGDGDLAAWAGAPFRQGDDQTGELMPVTLCFVLSSVDDYAYAHGPKMFPDVIQRIVDSGKYPLIKDRHFCNISIGPGTVGFNAGHLWDVDNTKPETVSRAMIEGRQIAESFRLALAEFHPKAFGNAFLASTGSLMGVRETRRIVGDYVLGLDDYLARRSFPDEICRNHYPVDIHTAKNEIEKCRRGALDVMNRYEQYKKGESHGVPYRCLTPKGLSNVLVAGRCVSADRPMQAAIRIMPACLAMGEAAGVAAAQAARQAVPDVHAVDTTRLRTRLREHGAWLP